MNKPERMILAAVEAGLKTLARYTGSAVAAQVHVAMRRAAEEIENMPDPAPAHCSYSDTEKGLMASEDAACLREIGAQLDHQLIPRPDILETVASRLELGWYAAPAGVKLLHYDASAAEIEGALRDALIERGWTPPGAIEATAAGAAAREAYDNIFHKVRAEVSFDWWCRIWLKALAWAGRAPRSLEETDLEILRKADARVGDFERLLEEIGIERRGRELVLTLTDAGGAKCWDITFLDADGASARTLVNWMMRKQALLHGESWPGHAAAAAAMMTAPNDEQKVQLTGEVSSDDRNPETMSLRLPTGFFCGPLGKAYEEPKWTEWDGSSRPGAWALTGHLWPKSPFVGVKLRVRFRDGDELETDAPEQMRWAWSRPYVSCADIVAYRVLD